MNNVIELEKHNFSLSKNKWLMELVHRTALAYSYSHTVEEKDVYLNKVKDNFISTFSKKILNEENALPKVKEILNKEIYVGEITTLLERISYVLYRKYIEDKEEIAEVTLSDKNLDKLGMSPAKFIKYTKSTAFLFKDFLETKVYTSEKKIILEFSLIF